MVPTTTTVLSMRTKLIRMICSDTGGHIEQHQQPEEGQHKRRRKEKKEKKCTQVNGGACAAESNPFF